MTGLSTTGFQIERLPEIRDRTEADITEGLGNVDLRAESVFGQLVGISSEQWALLWQLAEDVYFSQYPDTASGVALDHVCALNGVVRLPARSTQVEAIAYGSPRTVLAIGREVASVATGDVYRSTETVEILRGTARFVRIAVDAAAAGEYRVRIRDVTYTYTADGSDTIQTILTGLQAALAGAAVSTTLGTGFLDITDTSGSDMSLIITTNLGTPQLGVALPMAAIETGPLALGIGDLTDIKTPVAGWDAVDNLVPGIAGADRESDGALRARREKSIQITATNTLDAITARLRQVADVTDVNVGQNNTDATDANGTLRQHVWAIVEGGADEAIADVMWNAVAAGIGYRGAVTVNVTSDLSGKSYPVAFDRPTYVDPTIAIEITKLADFPAEGEELITAALVARTFAIGERLTHPRLYTQINSVPGVEVESLLVNAGTGNIIAAPNEKIRLLAENITITEAP